MAMRSIPMHLAQLTLVGLTTLGPMRAATAADLVDAWQGALQNDRNYAVARAAQAAAQPRRNQAAALWRPQVSASATVGVGSSQTEARGAQFSAPGLGTVSGADFNTSVGSGTATRWAISAVQPLYNAQRRAQQDQLGLAADLADLEAVGARQNLMLATAQRYFDVALADETVRLLQSQETAVQRAAVEAEDRFKLGAVPVTDTQEARARLASIRAQLLAARTDADLKRRQLADSTGLPATRLAPRLPAAPAASVPHSLDAWLADADAGNPVIRTRRLSATIASREASKFSLRASPTVDLVAQVGRDLLSGHGDYGSAANAASNRLIGVQVSIPLFTGGYRDAREQEAYRLVDQAASEVEQAREQTAQQVRAAWLGLSVGGERLQALSEGLAASQARRDSTALGQQVGHRTTQDLLNAENDQAAAALALAEARVALLQQRLRLAALAGQLDDDLLRVVNAELAPAP
jgi:outer membrane protein